MSIKALRFYLKCDDELVSRELALKHFGVADWFAKRMKSIKERLEVNEPKGVDIVNIFFIQNPGRTTHLGEWWHRANSFEYSALHDVDHFLASDPVSNIKELLPVAIAAMKTAPWPQVQALGEMMAEPLTDEDFDQIKRYMEKYRKKWDW